VAGCSAWSTRTGDAVHDLLERAATLYSAENALNTAVFPSLGRMQQDIVSISTGLLGGDRLPRRRPAMSAAT